MTKSVLAVILYHAFLPLQEVEEKTAYFYYDEMNRATCGGAATRRNAPPYTVFIIICVLSHIYQTV